MKKIRVTAWLTLFAFSITNTGWSAPVSLALPAENFTSAVIPEKIEIPADLGTVESQYRAAGNAPFILVLQDAHAILDAQLQTQKLLSYFQKQYGIDLVALEGGQGPVDATLFRAFPDEIAKKKIMGDYLEKAEITVAQMAAVFSEREGRYYGIEDWGLYEENYLAYARAAEKKTGVLEKMRELQNKLDEKRKQLFSPELNQLHEQAEAFREEKINLPEFLKYLLDFITAKTRHPERSEGPKSEILRHETPQDDAKVSKQFHSSYPHLAALINSLAKEESFKKEDSAVTLRKMAEAFRKKAYGRMDKKQEMEFNERFRAFQSGETDAGSFLKFLVEMGASLGFKPRLTLPMQALLGNVQTLSAIKGSRLFEELENFIGERKNALARSPEEKELVEKYRKLALLRSLASLELTHEQLREYQKDPPGYRDLLSGPCINCHPERSEGSREILRRPFGAPQNDMLIPALEFYRLALERDKSFRRNLQELLKKQKSKTAVVIAGGFHTRSFEENLKADGYSYAVIMPKIGSLDGKDRYANLMQGDLSYKNYLKTTFYDAFVRASTVKLVGELSAPDFRRSLKVWREEVLRQLAKEGRLTDAGRYTDYIDLLFQVYYEKFGEEKGGFSKEEILKALEEELQKFRKRKVGELWQNFESQLDIFTQGLKTLIDRKEVNLQNVSALLNRSGQARLSGVPQISVAGLMPGLPAPRIEMRQLFFEGKVSQDIRSEVREPVLAEENLPATVKSPAAAGELPGEKEEPYALKTLEIQNEYDETGKIQGTFLMDRKGEKVAKLLDKKNNTAVFAAPDGAIYKIAKGSGEEGNQGIKDEANGLIDLKDAGGIPGIPELLDIGRLPDGRIWIQMKSVRNAHSIDDPDYAPADVETLLAALIKLAESLEAAHQKGKAHNDIKGSNLLVSPEGNQVNDWETISDVHQTAVLGFSADYTPYNFLGWDLKKDLARIKAAENTDLHGALNLQFWKKFRSLTQQEVTTGRQRDVFAFLKTAADLLNHYGKEDFLTSKLLQQFQLRYLKPIFRDPEIEPEHWMITGPETWPQDMGEVIKILKENLAEIKALPAATRSKMVYRKPTVIFSEAPARETPQDFRVSVMEGDEGVLPVRTVGVPRSEVRATELDRHAFLERANALLRTPGPRKDRIPDFEELIQEGKKEPSLSNLINILENKIREPRLLYHAENSPLNIRAWLIEAFNWAPDPKLFRSLMDAWNFRIMRPEVGLEEFRKEIRDFMEVTADEKIQKQSDALAAGRKDFEKSFQKILFEKLKQLAGAQRISFETIASPSSLKKGDLVQSQAHPDEFYTFEGLAKDLPQPPSEERKKDAFFLSPLGILSKPDIVLFPAFVEERQLTENYKKVTDFLSGGRSEVRASAEDKDRSSWLNAFLDLNPERTDSAGLASTVGRGRNGNVQEMPKSPDMDSAAAQMIKAYLKTIFPKEKDLEGIDTRAVGEGAHFRVYEVILDDGKIKTYRDVFKLNKATGNKPTHEGAPNLEHLGDFLEHLGNLVLETKNVTNEIPAERRVSKYMLIRQQRGRPAADLFAEAMVEKTEEGRKKAENIFHDVLKLYENLLTQKAVFVVDANFENVLQEESGQPKPAMKLSDFELAIRLDEKAAYHSDLGKHNPGNLFENPGNVLSFFGILRQPIFDHYGNPDPERQATAKYFLEALDRWAEDDQKKNLEENLSRTTLPIFFQSLLKEEKFRKVMKEYLGPLSAAENEQLEQGAVTLAKLHEERVKKTWGELEDPVKMEIFNGILNLIEPEEEVPQEETAPVILDEKGKQRENLEDLASDFTAWSQSIERENKGGLSQEHRNMIELLGEALGALHNENFKNAARLLMDFVEKASKIESFRVPEDYLNDAEREAKAILKFDKSLPPGPDSPRSEARAGIPSKLPRNFRLSSSDTNRITWIFDEMSKNVIQHVPEKNKFEIIVLFYEDSEDKNKGLLKLTFKDRGPGLPLATLIWPAEAYDHMLDPDLKPKDPRYGRFYAAGQKLREVLLEDAKEKGFDGEAYIQENRALLQKFLNQPTMENLAELLLKRDPAINITDKFEELLPSFTEGLEAVGGRGLAPTYRMVTRMRDGTRRQGADMRIFSEKDKGTTIEIEYPLTRFSGKRSTALGALVKEMLGQIKKEEKKHNIKVKVTLATIPRAEVRSKKKTQQVDFSDQFFDGSIFDAEFVRAEREISAGQKTIAVDLDDTLIEGTSVGIKLLLPEMLEELEKLREDGFRIVLWTTAKRRRVEEFFKLRGTSKLFDRIITYENLFVGENKQIKPIKHFYKGYEEEALELYNARRDFSTHTRIKDISLLGYSLIIDNADPFPNIKSKFQKDKKFKSIETKEFPSGLFYYYPYSSKAVPKLAATIASFLSSSPARRSEARTDAEKPFKGAKKYFIESFEMTPEQIDGLQHQDEIIWDLYGRFSRKEHKPFRYDIKKTPGETVNNEFEKILKGSQEIPENVEGRESLIQWIISRAAQNPDRRVTIVDWGAGSAHALVDLAKELQRLGVRDKVRLIGFSDMYFGEWEEAAANGIEFKMDPLPRLAGHFAEEEIDLIYSYWGLRQLEGKAAAHLLELQSRMALGGIILSNSNLPESPLKDELGRGFEITEKDQNFLLKRLPKQSRSEVRSENILPESPLSAPVSFRSEARRDGLKFSLWNMADAGEMMDEIKKSAGGAVNLKEIRDLLEKRGVERRKESDAVLGLVIKRVLADISGAETKETFAEKIFSDQGRDRLRNLIYDVLKNKNIPSDITLADSMIDVIRTVTAKGLVLGEAMAEQGLSGETLDISALTPEAKALLQDHKALQEAYAQFTKTNFKFSDVVLLGAVYLKDLEMESLRNLFEKSISEGRRFKLVYSDEMPAEVKLAQSLAKRFTEGVTVIPNGPARPLTEARIRREVRFGLLPGTTVVAQRLLPSGLVFGKEKLVRELAGLLGGMAQAVDAVELMKQERLLTEDKEGRLILGPSAIAAFVSRMNEIAAAHRAVQQAA